MLGGEEYMLYFAGNSKKGHQISASGWTLDLEVVAVIHPETLETLDEQEIDGCKSVRALIEGIPSQMGPLQLLLPPNMPLLESAGQYSTLNSWPLTI